KLAGLLTGQTETLILVNPPPLDIPLDFNLTLPILNFGIPFVADVYVNAAFHGGFHFQANISAGLDTRGLRNGISHILDGLFLGYVDPVTNKSRPTLMFTGDIGAEIQAGVEVLGAPVGQVSGSADLSASV